MTFARVSNNQGFIRVNRFTRPDMLNSAPPVCAQEIKPQTVLIRIDFLDQFSAEKGPHCRIDGAFENRVLHPLPVILANLCNTPKPGLPPRIGCGYVVAHYNQHGVDLLPDKRRIRIQIAPEHSGKQERLDMEKHADVHFFFKERVHHFFLFSVLVGDEHLLSGFIGHDHGP